MERLTYIPVEALGITEEQAETVAGMKGAKAGEWEHFTPSFVGTKIQTLDLGTAFKDMNASQKLFTEARLSQSEGRVEIPTDLPITIVHLGDLHLGSVYADHNEIQRKFDIIKKTPNCYVVFMANLIDNAQPSKFPDGMLSNSIPPDQQVVVMRKMIKELDEKGKVLGAVTSPCHEGWSYRATGQDINALLFGYPERKFPVLENGGRLHVKVGQTEYMGALYHQVGPYESNFNETHALRQLNRLQLGMNADWVAGAHKHVAAAQMVYEDTGIHRKEVAYIRTGSEKGSGEIYDQWAIGRYGSTAEPTGQMLHLWPEKRRMHTTLDFDTGILAHEAFYLTAMVKRDSKNTV